jgi:hypothetical protein
MKALILYRSFYGNTKQVAEAIAGELRAAGHEAAVRDVRGRLPALEGTDIVFIGAPTRMARPGRRALRALGKLKRAGLEAGKTVAVFDTYGPVPADPEELERNRKWLYPGAAGVLQQAGQKRGLKVHPEVLRCEVKAMKGPLSDQAPAQAAEFVRGLLAGPGRV